MVRPPGANAGGAAQRRKHMTLRGRTLTLLNSMLAAADVQLVRKWELTQLQSRDKLLKVISSKPEVKELLRNAELLSKPSYNRSPLPADVESCLRHDNPRLLELRRRYHALDHPATVQSLWTNGYVQEEVDLRYFRGDNAYVWQPREMLTDLNYLLTAYYVQTIDECGNLTALADSRGQDSHQQEQRQQNRAARQRALFLSLYKLWKNRKPLIHFPRVLERMFTFVEIDFPVGCRERPSKRPGTLVLPCNPL